MDGQCCMCDPAYSPLQVWQCIGLHVVFRSSSLASHLGQMLCSSEYVKVVLACSPTMAQKLAGIGMGIGAVGTSEGGGLGSGAAAGSVFVKWGRDLRRMMCMALG